MIGKTMPVIGGKAWIANDTKSCLAMYGYQEQRVWLETAKLRSISDADCRFFGRFAVVQRCLALRERDRPENC